jgi:OOP family OmpA-OmpF porin
MNKRMALNGLALLGLLASTTVLAETQPGFYVGASIGQSKIKIDGDDFDANDTGFKVFGGYNFNRYFAVEATYFDGGKPDQSFRVGNTTARFEVAPDGLNLSAVGRLPITDAFSLFGKLGFASYDVKVRGRVDNQTIVSGKDSDEDLSYGLGGSFHFGAFELRAEYEGIDISDGNFSFLSLGGVYKF